MGEQKCQARQDSTGGAAKPGVVSRRSPLLPSDASGGAQRSCADSSGDLIRRSGYVHRKGHRSILCGVPSAQRTGAVAVDASISQVQPEDAVVGLVEAADLEDALFNAAREHGDS